MTDQSFGDLVGRASGNGDLGAAAEWVRLSYDKPATYRALRRDSLDGARPVVYYLATPPATYTSIVGGLASAGLAGRGRDTRVVVEKPLGRDAASAREINARLAEVFDEEQIFRIDHYLAKDPVQNVLAFRFSNALFEPVWNRTMIDSIQITATEQIDIGTRAGYYDSIGAVRDMVQNHVLQLLALIGMEPPTTFDPADIRMAKTAVLRAVEPLDPSSAVRGQYEGYQDAEGVPSGSTRETYAAARISIRNWRWDGVPIFVRTGKALRHQVTEAVIRFRDAPQLQVGDHCWSCIPTLLFIRFQPHEGILLRIGAKRPGGQFEMVPAGMKLEYRRLTRRPLPDAYENALSEVLTGGHSVFPGPLEIERSWEIVDPLIKGWERAGEPEMYARGSWGPSSANALVAANGGGRWITSTDEPGTR